jgi:hypothetical protein
MRVICSDNFGTDGTSGCVEIENQDKCFYVINDFDGQYPLIVSYKEPNEVDNNLRFKHLGDHPGYVVIVESFDERYEAGMMLQWDDNFFVKKVKDETLEDFPEYFI